MKQIAILTFAVIFLLTACRGNETPVPTETDPTSTERPAIATLPTNPSPTPPAVETPDTATPTSQPVGSPVQIAQLNMLDENNGWGLDEFGQVLRTTEGIYTWVDVSPPFSLAEPYYITAHFYDPQVAVVAYTTLQPQTIYTFRSEDGGATWQAGTPVVSTEEGSIYPIELDFIDSLHGWYVGQIYAGMHQVWAIIYETLDGGLTWEAIHSSIDIISGSDGMGSQSALRGAYSLPYGRRLLTFVDEANGFAGPQRLYSTTNGGRSWMDIELPRPEDYPSLENAFEHVSPPWFINSDAGYLYMRIYDFNVVSLPPGDVFYGLPERLYLYFTHDGGETWTPYPAPALIGTAFFLDADSGWFLGKNDPDGATGAQLYRTEDGGLTWELIADLSAFPLGSAFEFVDETTGFAHNPFSSIGAGEMHMNPYREYDFRAGTLPYLFVTQDGGLTWDEALPTGQ
jgi:photosystem II stability/assembly factor-like uncharacterized protein